MDLLILKSLACPVREIGPNSDQVVTSQNKIVIY